MLKMLSIQIILRLYWIQCLLHTNLSCLVDFKWIHLAYSKIVVFECVSTLVLELEFTWFEVETKLDRGVFLLPACSACFALSLSISLKTSHCFIQTSFLHHFKSISWAAQPIKCSSNHEFVIQTAYRIKKCSSGWDLGPKLPVCIPSASALQ